MSFRVIVDFDKCESNALCMAAAPEVFEVREAPDPEPQAGEVRVHFAASGVCHSDLHYIKGDRMCPMPVVLGHEGAGVVEEVGPGVTYVKPGDHVILSLVPACGRCADCVAGRPNLCEVRYTLNGNLPNGTTRLRFDVRDHGESWRVSGLPAGRVALPMCPLTDRCKLGMIRPTVGWQRSE